MENKEAEPNDKVIFVFDLFDHMDSDASVDAIEIHQQYSHGGFLKFISVPIEGTKIFDKEAGRHPLFKIVISGHKLHSKDSLKP